MRSYRSMLREQKAQDRHREQLEAANEVAQYERYVDLLLSLHKECSEPWNWPALAVARQPVAALRSNANELAVQSVLDAYTPGFSERLFGGAKRRRAELEASVARARQRDDSDYGAVIEQYQRDHAFWTSCRAVGERIVAGDVCAYGDALLIAGAFQELLAFGTRVEIVGVWPDAMAFACEITDDELIPSEEVSLTSKGKLSTRSMAKGRYWALYQDHVCSAAIRVGREALAVLPVRRVVVNIGPIRTNPATGHREPVTYLAALFTHENLGRINLHQIDPSDSMANFPHRMRFKKTSGFEPIERMTLDENWVTTG